LAQLQAVATSLRDENGPVIRYLAEAKPFTVNLLINYVHLFVDLPDKATV